METEEVLMEASAQRPQDVVLEANDSWEERNQPRADAGLANCVAKLLLLSPMGPSCLESDRMWLPASVLERYSGQCTVHMSVCRLASAEPRGERHSGIAGEGLGRHKMGAGMASRKDLKATNVFRKP